MKIVTTDREHTKSAWKKGNPLLDEKEWDKYNDQGLEKRADQADFLHDMIIEKGLINLDKSTVRKYFKKWFEDEGNNFMDYLKEQ